MHYPCGAGTLHRSSRVRAGCIAPQLLFWVPMHYISPPPARKGGLNFGLSENVFGGDRAAGIANRGVFRNRVQCNSSRPNIARRCCSTLAMQCKSARHAMHQCFSCNARGPQVQCSSAWGAAHWGGGGRAWDVGAISRSVDPSETLFRRSLIGTFWLPAP